MAWTPRTTKSGIDYYGNHMQYWWNPSINPNATPSLCLANCTTYAYGRILEAGSPAPVSTILDASRWHLVVDNGWIAIPYGQATAQVGDIIEWTTGNDVAVVEKIVDGVPWLSGSFFTDDHGTAHNNRTFTEMPADMAGISEWMQRYYDWRFFHYHEISWYNSAVGSTPAYVLRNPDPEPTPPEPPIEDNSLIIALSGTILQRRKKKNVKLIL